MGDLAASGGYWVATAADEVIADAGHDHRLDRRVRAAAHRGEGARQAGRAHRRRHHHLAGRRPTTRAAPSTRASPRWCRAASTTPMPTSSPRWRRRASARRSRSMRWRRAACGPAPQAQERGLVDRLGSYGDALEAAAQRGKLAGRRQWRVPHHLPGARARAAAAVARLGRRLGVRAWPATSMPRGLLPACLLRRHARCARAVVAGRADAAAASLCRWRRIVFASTPDDPKPCEALVAKIRSRWRDRQLRTGRRRHRLRQHRRLAAAGQCGRTERAVAEVWGRSWCVRRAVLGADGAGRAAADRGQHYGYVPFELRAVPVAVVVSPEQMAVYEHVAQAAARSGAIRRAFLSRDAAQAWLREQVRALTGSRAWWSVHRSPP